MKVIKTIRWKYLYKIFGIEHVNDKIWHISDEVKDKLEEKYPKRCILYIDAQGIHLISRKASVEIFSKIFDMNSLLHKLSVDIITRHNKDVCDIWYPEIESILKHLDLYINIEQVSIRFYDFIIGKIVTYDKEAWIEIDLRRDISLREWWLSEDYVNKSCIDESIKKRTDIELKILKMKLHEWNLDSFEETIFNIEHLDNLI